MSIDTGSDHDLVSARLILNHLEYKSSLAQKKRKGEKRIIFEYDKATIENWNNYKEKLHNLLKKYINQELLLEYSDMSNSVKHLSNINLDREWDSISRCIKRAAEEEIPKKKILNSGINKSPKKRYTELQIAINKLKKIIRRCKKEKNSNRDKDEQRELEREIEKINKSTNSSIELQDNSWSEILLEELTRWWSITKGKLVAENMNMINLEIRESVNQRCEMLKDNQRRMINSILEKPFKKIAIDRILINEAKGKDFFNDPDEVLEKTAEHFSKQFKKRNFQEEVMSDEWKEIYKPITRIKEGVYRNLSNRITKEE